MHVDAQAPLNGAPSTPAATPAGGMRALMGRVLRRALWTAVLLWMVFAVVVLVARELVLPRANDYREDFARRVTEAIGTKVTIGHIDARWAGIRPYLDLGDVKVHDRDGRVALELDMVRTSLSWSSIPFRQLRLHRLEIDGPELQIRRDAAGKFYVAGIELTGEGGNGELANWLLAQDEVVVRGAVLRWQDERRGAPELALRAVDLRLSNGGARHRFGLTAEPPADFASPLDLRGEFHGRDFARFDDWRGQFYVDVAHADLAVWRKWIDYPVDLPRGSGGLRLWADLEGARLAGFTGDVSLKDVELRLRDDLPMIDLVEMRGRIAAKLPVDGFDINATGLSLATRDNTRISPTDLHLAWHAGSGGGQPRGELTASEIDLGALNKLAGNLPFDAATRRALDEFDPRGKVSDLKVDWTGDREKLTAWHGRARFADTALQARGLLPGFTKVSGSIDASQAGGKATIAGRGASLDLPRVFAERLIAFDDLDAEVSWTVDNGRVDVHFPKVQVANADIEGGVSGHFTAYGDGRESPGDIDLTGSFHRGTATEVWRYMPFVAGEQTRIWLKDALRDGKAENVKLRIKGDLWQFPWIGDKGGEFRVSGDFSGGRLVYAQGWPEIRNITGSLLFHAERMLITGKRAAILGAAVSDTTAEIPNLMHPKDARLLIKGRAEGPTREFLAFIAASPVSRQIDDVTREMSADGNGGLTLAIDMPLDRVAETRVNGSYAFAGNELRVDPGVPPFTETSGRLDFTDRGITLNNATARLFGAPVQASAQTDADGKVTVKLGGSLGVADLRRVADSPWFDHLSGSAPWTANVAVRGKTASLVVESTLQGITSSLPEPLNKPAGSTLPLRIEVAKPPGVSAGADEIHLTIENLVDMRLLRRRDGDQMAIERGGIGIRQSAPMADRGIAVAGMLDTLDLDAWRRLTEPAGDAPGNTAGGAALPVTTVTLRTATLNAFGQHFSGLALAAMQVDGAWQARIDSKEMAGDLAWRTGGRGRLRARLKHLALSDVGSTPSSARAAADDRPLQELPGLDVVADSFSLRGKPFGKLELVAVNRGNLWQIDRFSIANPDGTVTGNGQWRMADGGRQASETQITFKLESGNVGKLLERVGYEDAVRRANATLEGKLSWTGAPTHIDYPSLTGEMQLAVQNGQFNKLEPGVGRLLGVMSLQSLPRRITLDFRDVFSDGFAFDSISGSMKVTRGIMRTEDLAIRGPAARVNMSGSTDLAAETQDLRVKVQPTLSESVALGAAIANPVAGVATFLAQKVLRDPIEKLFSYEYGVSGTWQDPQVIKLAAARQAPAPAEIVR